MVNLKPLASPESFVISTSLVICKIIFSSVSYRKGETVGNIKANHKKRGRLIKQIKFKSILKKKYFAHIRDVLPPSKDTPVILIIRMKNKQFFFDYNYIGNCTKT